MIKTYLFLIGAIFCEVAGTMLLPISQNFTKFPNMSSTFTIFEHIREIPTKFHQNFAETMQKSTQKSEKDFNSFFNVPFNAYGEHSPYVSPLKSDFKRILSNQNPLFKDQNTFTYFSAIKSLSLII